MQLTIKTIESLKGINRDDWNSLIGESYPFVRYEFLIALENNNAVGEEFGWLTKFFLAYSEGKLVGALPAYLKFNSYGEFVFLCSICIIDLLTDWSILLNILIVMSF